MTDDRSIHDSSLSLPLLEHIDSICTDFETAWQAATPPPIDEYLGQAQGAERSELLRELLRLELEYRSRRLHDVSAAVLQRDYPDEADLIANVFRDYAEHGQRPAPPGDLAVEGGATTIPVYPASTLGADGDSGSGSTRFAGHSMTGAPRFRIKRSHAKGGLGEVFVAHDQELHRDVALKEIQKQHAQCPSARSRFSLEAEITGRLEHPGIVPVYSLGALADGRPFYAMRFIRGKSLQQAIQEFHESDVERSAPERTIEFHKLLGRFVDVCQTIEYTHSRGVLHRDLKPSNIMLGKYGETLVVDWGLAKATGDKEDAAQTPGEPRLTPRGTHEGAAQTAIGTALGTPTYMSPEQAAGKPGQLGPHSDIYSLGATLYTILTGKAPFAGNEISKVLREVRAGEFAAPRAIDSRVPRALEAVCLKAMALKPDDRYESAQALEAIEAELPGMGTIWTMPSSGMARRSALCSRSSPGIPRMPLPKSFCSRLTGGVRKRSTRSARIHKPLPIWSMPLPRIPNRTCAWTLPEREHWQRITLPPRGKRWCWQKKTGRVSGCTASPACFPFRPQRQTAMRSFLCRNERS